MDQAALAATGVAIELLVDPAPTRRSGQFPLTGGAKQVLDTLREAIGMGSRRLEPEHILIALTLRPPRDGAIRLLEHAGLSPDAIRRLDPVDASIGLGRPPADLVAIGVVGDDHARPANDPAEGDNSEATDRTLPPSLITFGDELEDRGVQRHGIGQRSDL